MEITQNEIIYTEADRQREAWRAASDYGLLIQARTAIEHREIDTQQSISALLDLIEEKSISIHERESKHNLRIDKTLGKPGDTITIGGKTVMIDTIGVWDITKSGVYALEPILIEIDTPNAP